MYFDGSVRSRRWNSLGLCSFLGETPLPTNLSAPASGRPSGWDHRHGSVSAPTSVCPCLLATTGVLLGRRLNFPLGRPQRNCFCGDSGIASPTPLLWTDPRVGGRPPRRCPRRTPTQPPSLPVTPRHSSRAAAAWPHVTRITATAEVAGRQGVCSSRGRSAVALLTVGRGRAWRRRRGRGW